MWRSARPDHDGRRTEMKKIDAHKLRDIDYAAENVCKSRLKPTFWHKSDDRGRTTNVTFPKD